VGRLQPVRQVPLERAERPRLRVGYPTAVAGAPAFSPGIEQLADLQEVVEIRYLKVVREVQQCRPTA
jgi:hypothetical protein